MSEPDGTLSPQRNPIVLASASPRRSELLALAGLHFDIAPADLDETPIAGELPIDYVCRLAVAKATAVAAEHPGRVVLAADTTVDLDGTILGKPVDDAEAIDMLAQLSGRAHFVHTGVAVADGDDTRHAVVTTAVRFGELSPDEIRRYVATGEPLDKAGAYAIQGAGGALIERVDGSPTNVIGLPVRETLALLGLL